VPAILLFLVFVQTPICLNKDASSDLVYTGLQAAFTTVLPTVVNKYSDF
jgi:hypothetical protein